MHFLKLLNFCVFPSPHGRTFLCPLLVVVVSVGCHWLDAGPLSHRFLRQVNFLIVWEVFSDRMASKEEKAAWKCPVKFKLPSMFGRIVPPAVPVGFQPIREFHLISRCWDVEDQRVLCFVVWVAPDVFWTRRMRLRQKNIVVDISDFEISCFGSVFLSSSCRTIFLSKSVIHLLHISIF